MRTLARRDLDWHRLAELAMHHRVLPTVHQSLVSAAADQVPGEQLNHFRKLFSGIERRNFAFTGELLRLLNLLHVHGIEGIPYRGPVLAAEVYGDLAMRQFGDLDILLHSTDVLAARDLLVAHGFRPKFTLTPSQERAYLRAQSEYPLLDETGEILVELHWRFTEQYFCFPLFPQDLWERLVPASLEGLEIRSLSPEDLLLVLCVHGTKHVWERLGWICDVARLLCTHPALDWTPVLEQARALGSERMLLLGLALAGDRLGAPLPAPVAARLRADAVVGSLADQVWDWLFLEPMERPGDWATWRFHMRARERWRDRLNHSVRLATTTTPGDWSMVRLPGVLFPLYYAIRPFRLVKAYGSSLLRRRR